MPTKWRLSGNRKVFCKYAFNRMGTLVQSLGNQENTFLNQWFIPVPNTNRKGISRFAYVFFTNSVWHTGQVICILPFPLGTRNLFLHLGQ